MRKNSRYFNGVTRFIGTLLGVCLMAIMAWSTAFGEEVIYHTSFEKELAPWFSYFTHGLVWDDSRAHSDTRALLITRNAGEVFEGKDPKTKMPPDTGYWWSDEIIAVRPSTTYSISCWVLSELKKGEAGLNISFYYEDGRSLEVTKEFRLVKGATPGWVEMGTTITTPSNAGAMKIGMMAWKPEGRVWFDDLLVRKGPWEVTVPYGKVKIDGVVTPEKWKNAAVLTDFEKVGGSGIPRDAAEQDTVVYMLNDWEHLYIGAVCRVANPKDIVVVSSNKRDGPLWTDSCLEFFFDLRDDGASYLHYIVNAAGQYYDAYCQGGSENTAWDSDVRTATSKRGDAWMCELAIPLKTAFALNPQDHPDCRLKFTLNVCRAEKGGSISSWAPLGSKGSFQAPERFIATTIDGNPGSGGQIHSFRYKGVMQRERNKVVRSWRVKDPLFRELVSSTPKKYPGEAAFMWATPIWPWTRGLALQYGLEWDQHAFAREVTGHNIHLVLSYFGWSYWPKEVAEQNHCPWVLVGNSGWALGKNNQFSVKMDASIANESSSLLFDPENRRAWLEKLSEVMDQWPLWSVNIGDELVWCHHNDFFQMKEKYGDRYPFLAEAQRQIKEKYGFGKYGCPDSIKDENPFKWIAYWRWFMDQFLELHREFSAAVRAKNPNIVTIGDDTPMGMNDATHLSRLGQYMDIFSGQLYHPSPDMQNHGFGTKLTVDLSGKEVWPCAHVENYDMSLDDEELNDMLSECVRVGATGFNLYPGDTAARFRRMNLTPGCNYGHRPRWEALLAIVDRMRGMNRLHFPVPDSAVLFSENTCHSGGYPATIYRPIYNALFTMLGPQARTWFKFVSDIQMEDHALELGKFKVVFVPSAKYATREVRLQIQSYVEKGGTLVILDPEAFAWDLDGTDTHGFTKALAGANLAGPSAAQTITTSGIGQSRSLKLPSRTSRWTLQAGAAAVVVATYDDGKPSVVKHSVGKGMVYYFAATLCAEDIVYSGDWIAFFKEFCTVLGLKTGQDIWRFRFDIPKFEMPKEAEGVCLTGNYFQWVLNEPVMEGNVTLSNGKYRYEGAKPDVYPEAGEVAFQAGKLTDRNRAINQLTAANESYSEPSETEKPNNVVGWKNLEACTVVFDLGEAREVSTVRAFASGEVPRMVVRCGLTPQTMTEVATCPAPTSGDGIEVRKLQTVFKGRRTQYVSLTFDPRKTNPFILAEVDIWGK